MRQRAVSPVEGYIELLRKEEPRRWLLWDPFMV
jgi:hypothetical protein